MIPRAAAVTEHHFPFAEADRCVLCGLCLPHCPTYRLTQDENESPRGRISLMRAVATGELATSPGVDAHIAHCLGCRACERVCPSGVRYGRLLESGRALLHPHRSLWRRSRVAIGLLVATVPRLRTLAGWSLWLYQRSGFQWLLRRSRVLARLGLARLDATLPRLALPRRWRARYAAVDRPRGRVALFLGCVARELDAVTIDAAIRALTRLGYEVEVPSGQVCCGALHRDAGDPDRAERLLAANRQAFGPGTSTTILTLVSGCAAVLADSGDGNFGRRVQDINGFLAAAELPAALELGPLPYAVAVQDPCSLRNVLRAEAGVYRLLERIPGIRLVALPDNHLCCGGAGTYPLRNPEMAERLRNAKIALVAQLRPDIMVSANLGCVLHLRGGLVEARLATELVHPVVLFERQLRERSVHSLSPPAAPG